MSIEYLLDLNPFAFYRNAALSDNDSDDSNVDLEHHSSDHIDELDRHRLSHPPFAAMRNSRISSAAGFVRGFSSHNSSPCIRTHGKRRSSRHRRSRSHTVLITTGTTLCASIRGCGRPGHHRIPSSSRVSLGAIEGKEEQPVELDAQAVTFVAQPLRT